MKEQSILDVRKYSFFHSTINVSTGCVHASSVDILLGSHWKEVVSTNMNKYIILSCLIYYYSTE